MTSLSKSASGLSTPIRALPSNLASRAAPSVPPASQTYEPLVKEVLRHRLLRVFLSSALFSWALVSSCSGWSQGGVTTLGFFNTLLVPILPSTLAFAASTWVLGVVPVVVLRKSYLTATPTAAASPSKVFSAATDKRNTLRSLSIFMISSLFLTCIHVATTYVYEATSAHQPHLTLFVKSKKHPYYLNGRLLFLVTSQLSLAALYLLRNLMIDRFLVRWKDSLGKPEVRSFMLARVITGALSTVFLAVMSTAAHVLLFGLSRSILLPLLYKLPFLHRILRPVSAHFLRGSWSITLFTKNLALIYRSFTLAFTTAINWEFAESVFDSQVAEPVTVAHATADAALTLVSGITSKDSYYKYFAYTELQHLASDDSAPGSTLRTAMFSDQKYSPSMWATLARETLLALGNDYQLLLRRGAPPTTVPTPAVLPPKLGVPAQVQSTPLVRTQVLKPAHPSPLRSALDTFAADGPISAVISSTAEAGASQIPELFRSVMPAHSPVAAKVETAVETVKKGEEEIKNIVSVRASEWQARLYGELTRYSPHAVVEIGSRVANWWTRERVNKVVEASLPNRKMDALAIDALCSLVCTSLTEDRYGVVQCDIPRILEALLSFLTAIEDYQSELRTRYPALSQEELDNLSPKELAEKEKIAYDVVKAGDILSEVADPLKEGIVRVVRTFGHRLAAFKFSPRTAKKLQGFVDYS